MCGTGRTRRALAAWLALLLAIGGAPAGAAAETLEASSPGESLEVGEASESDEILAEPEMEDDSSEDGACVEQAEDAEGLSDDCLLVVDLEDGSVQDGSDEDAIVPVGEESLEDARASGDADATGLSAQAGVAAARASVAYRVHRQTYGWESGWKKDGKTSGTTGQSKRLEGIRIKLSSKPVSGGIKYRTHVQTYGWESSWATDGSLSGTTGQSKRLEAIQIKLTGSMANKYDVWYRVHAQTFGWMGWAKNGAKAGTAGYSKRLEAIQIRLVSKGGAAPGSTSRPYRERKKVTRTYSSLYGPTLRSIGAQKQREYSATGRGADVYYFLYDINRDGIKELVVLDRTYGMSDGMVYTIRKSGSQLVSSYVDVIGGGQHYVYHAQSQSLIMAYSGPGGYAYYRVGISGGRVTTAEIASYRSDQQSQLPDYGSPLTEYDVVRDGFLSINYTALSRAGSVSVSV